LPQASSAPASRLTATQARFWVKLAKGRLASPQSQLRTWSSTRAWPRWRSSRTAASIWSALALVMRLYAFEWGEVDRILGGFGRDGQVTPPAWSNTRSR